MALKSASKSVALITGASSGMGKSFVKALPSQGVIVYTAARRVEQMSGLANFACFQRQEAQLAAEFRYVPVMGMKEDNVRGVGFSRLAIFRPGIIVGNAHTPPWVRWLGSLVPGSFDTIDQQGELVQQATSSYYEIFSEGRLHPCVANHA